MKWSSVAAAGVGCFLLWGCIFDSSTTPPPFIPMTGSQLNPESDAFATASSRSYTWKEGWKIGTRDTSVASRNLSVTKTGSDSIHGYFTLHAHFNAVDGKVLPSSVMMQLGLNSSRVQLDNVATAIPDPGPALRFPVTPVIGWHLDTTVGDLRFAREMVGFDTLSRSEGRVEAWAFAETTYCAGIVVATARYSFGSNGLLHLYEKRPGFYSSTGDTGAVVLWREITAQ